MTWSRTGPTARRGTSTSGFPQRAELEQVIYRLAHLDAVMLEEASQASDRAVAAEAELVAA